MSDEPIFEALQPRNLKQQIAEVIRQAILTGKLKPGQRIREQDLVAQLNVSRAPIREAISSLQEEGLLVVVNNKGCYVFNMTAEDVEELIDLRSLLEVYAIEIVFDRLSDEDFQDLDSLVRKMHRAVRSNRQGKDIIQTLAEVDLQFHNRIVGVTKRKRLIKILNSLSGQLRAVMVATNLLNTRLDTIPIEHSELLDFIRSGDLAAAKEEMRAHVNRFGNELLESLRRHDSRDT